MQKKSLKSPTLSSTNKIKKAALCTNIYSDPGLSYTMQVVKQLRSIDIGVSVFVADPLPKDYASPAGIELVNASSALRGADVLICAGGDGTILHIASRAAVRSIPVIGINLGHTGFMTELAKDEVSRLKTLLTEDFQCYERMMAEVSIIRNGKKVYSALALNDAVIAKGVEAKTIDLSVYADDSAVSKFSGDGMLVCTPTGSTAYSMSAGGPIVEPEAENLIITPICAHSLQAKSFVLSPGRTVCVTVGNLRDRFAFLSVDGGKAKRLSDGDCVTVMRAQHKLKLIKADRQSFYNKIYFKLNAPRGE